MQTSNNSSTDIPNDTDTECSLLATCFIMPDAADTVCQCLSESDFYWQKNAKIFKAICEAKQDGCVVDLVVVFEILKRKGGMESVGGPGALVEMIRSNPVCHNIDRAIAVLKEKSKLRKLMNIGYTIIRNVADSPDMAVCDAQKMIGDIDDTSVVKVNSLGDLLPDAKIRYETIRNEKKTITGIRTGLYSLDRVTSGLQKQDFIVVAARPGMGKTSFASSIMLNAIKQETPCQFFSLEMSKGQIIDRFLAAETRSNIMNFRNGRWNDAEYHDLRMAMNKLNSAPLYIDDTAGIHYREIVRRTRVAKRKHGIEFVCVDYLQLVGVDKTKNGGRNYEIEETTRCFKNMAKELDIPVMVLSQLNRAVEQRTDKHPLLSDLRDSGSIEQDADMVMMLYRPEYYTEGDKEGVVELDIAKHRNGPTCRIDFAFLKKCCRFENIQHEDKACEF